MLIIDRFEDGFAVCLDGTRSYNIPISEISGNAAEGDIIKKTGEFYTPQKTETERRREIIREKENDLWE